MARSPLIAFRPGASFDSAIDAEIERTGKSASDVLRAALAMYFAKSEKKRDEITADSPKRGRPTADKATA